MCPHKATCKFKYIMVTLVHLLIQGPASQTSTLVCYCSLPKHQWCEVILLIVIFISILIIVGALCKFFHKLYCLWILLFRWQLWDYKIFVSQSGGTGSDGIKPDRVRLMWEVKAALSSQASPNTFTAESV